MRESAERPALEVWRWNGPGSLPAAALRANDGPIVLGIATPDTPIRNHARVLGRSALRDALGILLGRAPHDIPLISQPGEPLRLDLPGLRIGLSLSHEPGLTLAAIHMQGAVGIDLMRVEKDTNGLSGLDLVARDYFGPQAAARIGGLPRARQAQAFALAWTRLEACLKCRAMPLQEWSPALERQLEPCSTHDIALPEGLVATLAVCA